MEKKNKQYFYIPYKAIAVLVIIFISAILFVSTRQNKAQITSSELPAPTNIPITNKSYPTPPPYTVVLRRKSNKSPVMLYTGNISGQTIIRWKDYLIYSAIEDNRIITLKKLNLKTDEESNVYKVPKGQRNRSIYQIKEIDGNIYFTIGGYLAGGGVYWFDPNTTMEPQQILDKPGSIELINNLYWIRGGTGDGCGGNMIYYRLDTNTKTAIHIADTLEGCMEGEGFLGIDNSNHLLVGKHQNPTDHNSSDQMHYLNVSSIDISNPALRKMLITEEQMPENIYKITFNEAETGLLLYSQTEAYQYTFATNTLEKLPVYVSSKETDYFNNPHAAEKKFEDLVKELNIPDNYTLTFE